MNEENEVLLGEINAFKFDSSDPIEWQRFFDKAIKVLHSNKREHKRQAINRLTTGIWAERMTRHFNPACVDFVPLTWDARLIPILNALADQKDDFEVHLREFTHSLSGSLYDDLEFKTVLEAWLNNNTNEASQKDARLLATLEAGLFEMSSWSEAESFLMPYLDSESISVRASAAGAIAKLYQENLKGLPDLKNMMERIKQWDIQRPGVAGPFWSLIQFDNNLSGEEISTWMQEIISERRGDEPNLSFYNGIDFYAHEVMAGDPHAIKKLIEWGQEDIAAMAATEIDERIESIRPILIELANSTDEFIVRICSWHLANHYHFVHPAGDRLGFVKLEGRLDADVFRLYTETNELYSATIYPSNGSMDERTAWKWIQKFTSAHAQVEARETYKTDKSADYEVNSTLVELYGDAVKQQWDRVWIKWPKEQADSVPEIS